MQPPSLNRSVAKRLTRPEQKVRTRDRLLAAAARVIGRRGLGDASIDEISEDAGYSTGAFYANFASKDEVFAAALRFQVEELQRATQASPESDPVTVGVEWLSGLEDWRILFWLEIVAHGARSPQLRAAVADHLEAARASLREGLEEPGADDAATLMLAAQIGLAVQRLFGHDRLDADLVRSLGANASDRG